MKIGELARKAGTSVETIRFYEKESLLPEIARTESNYRTYNEKHVERLLFIRHCRSLDMTLHEIRQLLRLKDAPRASCDDVNAILDQHIGHIEERLQNLHKLQGQLKTLRHFCDQASVGTHCGILGELEHLPSTVTHALAEN